MPPSLLPKGFRGFVKRCTRGAKKVFRPRPKAGASESRRRPSLPQPLIETPVPIAHAGADTWSELKITLKLLEESDRFLTLKPAVAGFLVVLNIFEVSIFISYVIVYH
jgi:hypothetical protein